MNKMLTVGFSLLAATTLWGQGSVHFGNTATTLITTNDFQGNAGNIFGAGNYRFGLYVGPFGAASDSLTLVGVATNNGLAGRFDGGTGPFPGPSPIGSQVSFQVRGWSSFAGGTFETAYSYALAGTQPTAFLGESTIGFFTVPASGTVELFGTGPGQVGGFALTPIVPEPSMGALATIGVSILFLLRRRFV